MRSSLSSNYVSFPLLPEGGGGVASVDPAHLTFTPTSATPTSSVSDYYYSSGGSANGSTSCCDSSVVGCVTSKGHCRGHKKLARGHRQVGKKAGDLEERLRNAAFVDCSSEWSLEFVGCISYFLMFCAAFIAVILSGCLFFSDNLGLCLNNI